MPASGGSSNSSKKLLNLLFLMFIVVLTFAVIIVLWVMSGDPVSGGGTPTPSVNGSRYDTATSINISGINRVSLLTAVDRLNASGDTASWFRSNPEWRLFQAQADYVDGRGLSQQWNVIIRSANSSLIAYVDNGVPYLMQIEGLDGGDSYQAGDQVLLDSDHIVGDAVNAKNVAIDNTATPFALFFSDDGGDGTYRLTYKNTAQPGQSFVATYDARSGEPVDA